MTYYTVCPDCGYKLFKAGDGNAVALQRTRGSADTLNTQKRTGTKPVLFRGGGSEYLNRTNYVIVV